MSTRIQNLFRKKVEECFENVVDVYFSDIRSVPRGERTGAPEKYQLWKHDQIKKLRSCGIEMGLNSEEVDLLVGEGVEHAAQYLQSLLRKQ